MRGKDSWDAVTKRYTGITPAYAGKSSFPLFLRDISRDHPRLCGEKNSFAFTNMKPSGSPPPMRGKGCGNRGTNRNIWDHPRLCGEKMLRSGTAVCCQGSPPPMRGKGSAIARATPKNGITPAYAGKSFSFRE